VQTGDPLFKIFSCQITFFLFSPGFSAELSFSGIYQITWKNCLIIDVPFSFPWGLIEGGESISAESTVEGKRS
jgi:hypothetical protein